MKHSHITLPATILAVSVAFVTVAHAAVTSVSSPWKYGERVIITGEKLQGAKPEYKKLCIAPEMAKTQKECYYDFQLDSATWTDSQISFYPPLDAPIKGVVILQLDETVQKCFGSAGCSTYTEDVEKEIGNFTIAPYISKVLKLTTATSGVTATSIEPITVYEIQGKFFGDSKGSIYLRQPRGSKQVPADKIISWSSTSIVFSSPPDIDTGNGVSVNNGGTAQWFDFPANAAPSSSSSSSKRQQIDKSQYPEDVQRKLDEIDKESAQKMFKVLRESQDIVDKYAAKIQTAGTPSDAVCKSLNAKESTNECQTLCKQKTDNICRDACADSSNKSECSNTCYSYKKITDGEKSCVTACLAECSAGTPCVCEAGRVNKPAYRDYVMAKSSLTSGYKMLYEDDDADKDLVAALKKELESAGLQLVKSGDEVTLVKARTNQSTTGGTFSDVSKSHPYTGAIDWAKQSGILQGYPDGTFKPENVVNRAEFLKIVLGAKGINVSDAGGSSGFKDVDENGWYAPYVRYAKAQGIIQGYPDGTFKPDQAVNFAEALKMAYNALGISTDEIGGQWYDRFLQHAKLNSVLFASDARVDAGMSRKDVIWIVWKLMTNGGTWKQPTKASVTQPASPTTAAGAQFKDGDHIVGTDIQAGTYRTRKGSSGCYYARLSGFSGELDDIITNENTDAPAIITIAPTDKGFKSSRCGTWTQDLSAITTSRTSFGDGVFIVGTDIEAGTYKSTGGSFCYYSRLSGFTGELEDIISNENTTSSAIVTISASDKGFKSARCGTWTKID